MRTWHDDLRDLSSDDLHFSIPVQVVGTPTSQWGHQKFPNLTEALKVFPTLDPFHNGKEFTWAMMDSIDGKPAMRFESWAAERMYSI